jgi:hypothetical protein
MSRKREIKNDLWEVLCKVYSIPVANNKSDRQEELLNKIVDYIDTNLSTRRKRPDKGNEKEIVCSSEQSS